MQRLYLFFIFALLIGCNQQELIQKFSSTEDQAYAKGYIDNLRTHKFENIEKNIDQSIKGPNLVETLEKMSEMLPMQEPTAITLVGARSNISVVNDKKKVMKNITFEYNFSNHFYLINVATLESNDLKTIIGFNVSPESRSLEDQNKFSLTGKNATQYIIFIGAVLAFMVTIYSLISCVKTKFLKRKWLWILFIIFGFGQFAVNWATGQYKINLAYIQLLSASFFSELYGPWIITVSLPIGAVVFLFYRRSVLLGIDTNKGLVSSGN